MVLDGSYQVNIGGGLRFLAAAAAFSISAFKGRIFLHNDRGNNNGSAAAVEADFTSNPAHNPTGGAAAPLQPSSIAENSLLLSDDRGCPAH